MQGKFLFFRRLKKNSNFGVLKSIFDDLDNIKMIKARSRANPFETIASCIFQNRAAMKMANIDSVFGYMFTNPKDPLGVKIKFLKKEKKKKFKFIKNIENKSSIRRTVVFL